MRKGLTLAALTIGGGVLVGFIGMGVAALVHALLAFSGGPAWLTVLTPTVGGVLAGCAWWYLRTRPVVPPLADALTQLLAAGTGLSIGREKAPRQMASTLLGRATQLRWCSQLSLSDIHILTTSAAGAGLAAVYNVPLAGVLFTFEVLRCRRSPAAVVIAGVMSTLATVIAWPVVGSGAFYVFPTMEPSWRAAGALIVFTLVTIPVAWVLGAAFRRGAAWAEAHRVEPGWGLVGGVGSAGLMVGLLAQVVPMVPGNGFEILQSAYSRGGTWAVFAALILVKPLLTVLTLRAGAVGGVLTPALATGAAWGAAMGLLLESPTLAQVFGVTHGGTLAVAAFALIGSACVLTVAQRAPLFAAVMAWELTLAPLWLLPLLFLAALGARAIDRLGGRNASPARGGGAPT